ncbi:TetR family transcriptional regulator [Streptomyces zingiberis]|uniref:TetR family transcriptional regulator n=1 Tax=Streptomyces zingiberis TaxID=2053010 RepID=A0ABX1BW84_9ACTN|nr:TetR family transcriptional regulator [Streptomyces zingiberis]NJQ00145.1 TetR family transcriptional regulator [Streptomyces zingiberis]
MSHATAPPPGSRSLQKLRTRQALLDAALALLEEKSLGSLGLREVTRAAGVTPSAFYRHFTGPAELGVALVEETLDGLHSMISTVLAETRGKHREAERAHRAVEAIARHVRAHPAHIRFVIRERHGSVRLVREAIGAQLRRFADEVAAEYASQPAGRGWSEDDLRMLGGVYVDQMVMTASGFLDAADDEHPEAAVGRVAAEARRRLRLIGLGRHHWPG